MKLNVDDYRFTPVLTDAVYTTSVDILIKALDEFMMKVNFKLKDIDPEVKEFTVSIISHTDSLKVTCDYDFSLMYANVLPTHVGVLNIRIPNELYMDTESWANSIIKFTNIRRAIYSYLCGMTRGMGVRLDEQKTEEKAD